MPKIAESYDFSDVSKVPAIDGEALPYYVSANPGPRVEQLDEFGDSLYILWVPVLMDGPMPKDDLPVGRPVEAVSPLTKRALEYLEYKRAHHGACPPYGTTGGGL